MHISTSQQSEIPRGENDGQGPPGLRVPVDQYFVNQTFIHNNRSLRSSIKYGHEQLPFLPRRILSKVGRGADILHNRFDLMRLVLDILKEGLVYSPSRWSSDSVMLVAILAR